jgi:hypothetical protein
LLVFRFDFELNENASLKIFNDAFFAF